MHVGCILINLNLLVRQLLRLLCMFHLQITEPCDPLTLLTMVRHEQLILHQQELLSDVLLDLIHLILQCGVLLLLLLEQLQRLHILQLQRCHLEFHLHLIQTNLLTLHVGHIYRQFRFEAVTHSVLDVVVVTESTR